MLKVSAALCAALALAGCAAPGTDPADPTTTAPAASAEASTTPTSTTAQPTGPEAAQDQAPAQAAPTITSCQEGGLGPITTYWSDGTVTGWSEYCQGVHDRVLAAEVAANTPVCDGVTCRYPSGATIPDPNAAPQGTTSGAGYSCDATGACYWPDGTPVIGADRCGTTCGEAPTSGEIQFQHGCEQGYIDPQECAANGY